MNISSSHNGISAESESGWTLYLDQSYNSASDCQRGSGIGEDEYCRERRTKVEDDDEEEDLSMVSDASSGPPHFHEEEYCFNENGCFYSASNSASQLGKKGDKKKKNREQRGKQRHSYLDDTASSPAKSFSKKKISNGQASMHLDFSQGYSATHLKGPESFQKHFGFLQPSFSEKPTSEDPGSFQGKWE
ncbi:protein SOB FIVE-LIKE 5-like [Malania oleifera]|uniref:protein SOB FIVE-LIKE 5-like n=1 Tax=Malania oleifera TaxID=397392 RepID=UPI0025AE0A7E|nr:protein SOB FIVE-LIKE 5-like [Malania oleifera]